MHKLAFLDMVGSLEIEGSSVEDAGVYNGVGKPEMMC